MHELYRVSRRPYLIAARPPDLAFNFLRTDYGLSWAFYNGSIDYNGGLPISEATGTYSVPTFSYYHSLSFFGRSANVVASLPGHPSGLRRSGRLNPPDRNGKGVAPRPMFPGNFLLRKATKRRRWPSGQRS